ncbi:MAG TPA: hypothetical protein VFE06_08965 [Acidobacteriaceae bacterium]|jgi:hypothetical protein|nr:hypothetical protein [Acidobacteriaceae bacterium]
MEVDRVGRMGPVTPERTPAWTREGLRRRRFVSEVEPEVEADPEDSTEGRSNDDPEPKPDLDVMA